MAADERRPVPAGPPVQFTGLPAGHPACLVGMRADWIAFYDAEYHFVVRFVMRNGASLEDACDAAEEAFLDSWALMTRQPDPLVASRSTGGRGFALWRCASGNGRRALAAVRW